jgi:hypothetical protein
LLCSGVRVAQSLCFCRLLFVLFLLAIASYVLQFMTSDFPFAILKRILAILRYGFKNLVPCVNRYINVHLTIDSYWFREALHKITTKAT